LSGCHEGKRYGAPCFLGPNSNLLVVLHELAVAGTAINPGIPASEILIPVAAIDRNTMEVLGAACCWCGSVDG